jgi:hypothetical protein
LALTVAHASLATSAFAADADDLLRRGAALRAEGKDAEALRLFQEADVARPTPTSKAQVALAEQALGMWVPAESHLLEALSVTDDPWVSRNRSTLDAALVTIRQHLGSLELVGGEPGATVAVDGIRRGTLPLPAPMRLEIGRRQLEVRLPGFHSVLREVLVTEGGMARESISMAKVEAATKVGVGVGEGPGRDPGGIGDPHAGQGQRTAGVLLMVLGGASLIFSGASLVVRESITQSFNANGACDTKPLPDECANQVSARDMWMALAIGAGVGGVVIGGGGAVLYLTAPSGEPAKRKASGFGLRCAPGNLSVTCAGVF